MQALRPAFEFSEVNEYRAKRYSRLFPVADQRLGRPGTIWRPARIGIESGDRSRIADDRACRRGDLDVHDHELQIELRQVSDLTAFLESLSDQDFIADPKFALPKMACGKPL